MINITHDYHRIPVEELPTEEARQEYAERFVLARYGYRKGEDYVTVTVSDEGRILIQSLDPIKHLKCEMGVIKKGESFDEYRNIDN